MMPLLLQAAPTPAPWTLTDVLRIAEQSSPRLQQAQARLERTNALAQRTLAPFRRPSATLTANYSRLSVGGAQSNNTGGGGGALQNPFQAGLNGAAPGTQPVALAGSTRAEDPPAQGGTPDLSQFGFSQALDQQLSSLSITQRIDITGLGRAYRSLTESEQAILSQEREQTRQALVFDVSSAYYSALRARALIRVSEAAVKQSEEQVRLAQSRFEQGSDARSDVLRAKSQLASQQQSLISARNQAAISQNALANAMGVPPTTPIALAPDDSLTLPTLPVLDEAELLPRALQKRPEAQLATLNRDKARWNLRIAHQGREPALNAFVGGTLNATAGIAASRRLTSSAGFSLTVPFSDGGVTASNVRAAGAEARLAAAQQLEYENGIKAEVQQSLIALRDAHDRMKNALPALDEAREGYRLSELRLKAGSATALALYDAQTTLIQAEVNAINARYDYFGALARLTRATGTSLPEGSGRLPVER
jgi:outer membrane protein